MDVSKKYSRSEEHLRTLMVDVCRQRNLFRFNDILGNKRDTEQFIAEALTLEDRMAVISQDNSTFSGTMRFYYRRRLFFLAAYSGFTDKVARRDLKKALDSGNIDYPFRGTSYKRADLEKKTLTLYGITPALVYQNRGEIPFCSEEDCYVAVQDWLILKNNQSDEKDVRCVHRCVFNGKIILSPKEMTSLVEHL